LLYTDIMSKATVLNPAAVANATRGVINPGLNNDIEQALYRCTDCGRWFPPGDTFVNGDGDEWCYADTGNGCIEAHFNQPGSDATR